MSSRAANRGVIVAGLALGALAAPARADQQASTLRVQATVTQTCSVDSSVALDFGPYWHSKDNDSSAPITVTCTTPGPVSVAIDGGQNPAGTRAMAGQSGELLGYLLAKDPNQADPWGDGASFGTPLDFYHGGGTVTRVVYGRIPRQQKVTRNELYQDQVQVTVLF